MKTIVPIASLALLMAACSREQVGERPSDDSDNKAGRAPSAEPYGGGPRQPDNTGVNERDREGGALTPMDQGGSESDRNLTAQIRRDVERDDALSTNAKNVKIITRNGAVTLRGPVASEQEKARIGTMAERVAGGDKVDNQLEVKP